MHFHDLTKDYLTVLLMYALGYSVLYRAVISYNTIHVQ